MMDTTNPYPAPNGGSDLGNNVDAYQRYINTGQLIQPPAPQPFEPLPPAGEAGAPTAAPAAAPQPTFADMVSQREAANGGKPLADTDLDKLAADTWAQEEPNFRASRKGLKEGDVKAEKAAYDNQYQQFKADYMKKHGVAPAAGDGSSALGAAGSTFGRSLGNTAIEAGRVIGGGVIGLGEGIGDAFQHHVLGNKNYDASEGPGLTHDKFYDWYDKALGLRGTEDANSAQIAKNQAAHPIASTVGGVGAAIAPALVGSAELSVPEAFSTAAPKIASMVARGLVGGTAAGVGQTLDTVGQARDAGATTAEQEGLLGEGLVANPLINTLLPGGGKGNMLTRAAKNAVTGAVASAGQQAAEHTIAPNQVAAPDAKSVATGGALQLLLGELAHRVEVRAAAKTDAAKTKADAAVKEVQERVDAARSAGGGDTVGVQTDGSQVKQDPVTGKVTIVPAGSGIAADAHKAVVTEAQQAAQDPSTTKAFDAAVAKNPLLKEPAARAKEVVAQAGAIAESAADDAGTKWSDMSPMQQHEATEAAATVLAKTTRTDGVPELLQAAREKINAQPTVPQVSETPAPGAAPDTTDTSTPLDIAAADPTARPPAARPPTPAPTEAAADTSATSEPLQPSPMDTPMDAELAQFGYQPQELSGMKTLDKVQLLTRLKRHEGGSVTPLNPDAARSIASEAMEGQPAGQGPIDTAPKDPLEQNASQAKTIIHRQLHDAMDTALSDVRKGVRKVYPPSKLATMTLEEKHNAYVKAVAKDPSIASDASPAQAHAAAANKMLETDPGAVAPLHPGTRVDASGSVPLGGGVSSDGKTIYIDKRIPQMIDVGGTPVNAHEVIAHAHEAPEGPQMHVRGKNYLKAHDENANTYEAEYLKQRYGVTHSAFNKALEPYLKLAKKDGANAADIPADLDRKPYVDSKTENLLGEKPPSPLSRKGVGAKKAPAPVDALPLEPTPSSENADAIGSLLEGKVTPADLADVRSMVERAQNGEPDDLHQRIREMRSDDTISPEEAKQLRQLGREAPREAALRDGATTDAVDAGADDLLDVQRGEPQTEQGKAADDVGRMAESIASNGLKSDKARAAELIVKLRKAFPNSEPHQKGIDFLAWTLGKNPALSRTIKDIDKVDYTPGMAHGGRFQAVSRIIELVDRPDMRPSTVVHELMHASESLLPAPIRNAIIQARANEITRLAPDAAPAEKPIFEYLQNSLTAKTPNEKVLYMQGAKDELIALRDAKATPPARIGELYSLINASEYWAVHATDMLEHGFANKGVLAQAREWLKGFVEQIRQLFGGHPNRESIIAGLDHVLGTKENGSQSFLRNYELTKATYAGQPEALTPVQGTQELHDIVVGGKKEAQESGEPGHIIANLVEAVANSGERFRTAEQRLLRLGIAIPDELNPYLAFKRVVAQRGYRRRADADDVVEPLKAHIVSEGMKWGKTPEVAVDKAGMFAQTHHVLTEWWPNQYTEEAPLDNGREVMRQKLLDKIQNLDGDPRANYKKLQALVKDNASMPLADWVRQKYGKAPGSDETIYDQFVRKSKELADEGMTPTTMSRTNDHVQAINDRSRQRLIESGKVAKDDPWVAARDNKWWVPLKGGALDGTPGVHEDVLPNELAQLTRQGRGYVTNAQLMTREGRATWASNPILRAITDMGTSASSSADHDFSGTLLTLINRNKKLLRQKVRELTAAGDADGAAQAAKNEFHNTIVDTWTGTPKGGYDNVLTGQHADHLPNVARSLVHNDGRNHYIMQFPEGSEMYHALQTINTNFDPREFPLIKQVVEGVEAGIHSLVTKPLGLRKQTHLISRSTGWMAQINTVVNPIWTIATLAPRLGIEKTLMLAIKEGGGVKDGMLLMAKAYQEIFSTSLSHGAGAALGKIITHDLSSLRAMAKADPDSYAGWYVRMNEAGNSTSFAQGLTMHESNNALSTAMRQSQQNPLMKGLRQYMVLSRGFADVAENLPSVGIFKMLVKGGMDERTAAAKVKDLLDLQQTGTAGRAMNGFHQFFRIIATVNDTMRRAFQHPEGMREVQVMGRTIHTSMDWNKIAKWTSVMAGYSVLKYYFDREMMGKDANGTPNIAKIATSDPRALVENVWLPSGNTDHPFKISNGLGFAQMLTAPGTLLAAVMNGDITKQQAIDAYAGTLQRNMSFIEPAGTPEHATALQHVYAYAMGATTPSALAPVAALATNVNSFGSGIHTNFPVDTANAADQGKTTTPQLWKEIAQSIQQHTGVDFYPETLPFVAQNYMGSSLNDLLRSTIGQVTRESEGLPGNAPNVVSRMQYQGADYYDSERLYQTIDDLQATQRQLHAVQSRAGLKGSPEFVAAGQQWLTSNPQAVKELTALKMLESARKAYQDGVKQLVQSKDGAERKQYVRKALDSQLRTATDKAQALIKTDQ